MTTILALTNQQLYHLKNLPYEVLEQNDRNTTIKVHFDRPTDLFYAGLLVGIESSYKEVSSVLFHNVLLQPKDQSNTQRTQAEAYQGREGNQ